MWKRLTLSIKAKRIQALWIQGLNTGEHMGRIYCIMGRSASGKDTVYRELKKRFPELSTYVMYTTRPMREGEIDGISYHFITDRELSEFEEKGRLIEKRVYHTVLGDWSYATVDDGQIELSHRDYLMLTTPEAFSRAIFSSG